MNLDLVEILKDCPIGTKFYSSYLGKNVIFIEIYDNHIKCEYTSQIDSLNCSIQFRKDGSLYPGGDCMLFPSKYQSDWSKWHRPFVKGDVLVSEAGNIVLCSHIDEEQLVHYHCILGFLDTLKIHNGIGVGHSYECTLANDAQKQRLFDALKKEGYEWNEETKTLEKFIEPIFKVGDRIIKKGDYICGIIKRIDTDNFYKVEYSGGGVSFINVKCQNEYELVHNKFDIKTLQPFDKVLVRVDNTSIWINAFYGFYDAVTTKKYPFVASADNWVQCIPYEGNEHLLGTDNDCDEYYKNW